MGCQAVTWNFGYPNREYLGEDLFRQERAANIRGMNIFDFLYNSSNLLTIGKNKQALILDLEVTCDGARVPCLSKMFDRYSSAPF